MPDASLTARIWARFLEVAPEIWQATLDTLYMTIISSTLAVALGMALAVLMIITGPQGLSPRKSLYTVVDFSVNLVRSFPFIILLIAIQDFTRLITGTSTGTEAMMVPLTLATAPFVARLFEGSMLEVDKGVIEAARSFGASNASVILRVLIPEALPSIILNIAVLAIVLLGFSAMAGIVGGGGLGDLAMKYGYYRYETDVMIMAVVVLVIIVLAIQGIGNFLYRILR